MAFKEYVSVRELIKFLAHNYGAVHAFPANAAKTCALRDETWGARLTTPHGQYSGPRGVQKLGSPGRSLGWWLDRFPLSIGRLCVVWSFAYVALCRLLQLVVLLGRSERLKELEILVLRHELAILRRQPRRVLFRPVDRAILAAFARSLPRSAWTGLSVRPATVLRWHRELVSRRWTYPQRRPGRPALDRRVQTLVVRLARENPGWGYRRIVGELRSVGISVSAISWRNFLSQHAASTLACDFFTVETAWLKRIYVLFFISLERRRIEFVTCTANPTGAWVAQQARNLLMTLDDRERPLRFLIHDRDSKFSGGCDLVFQSEGIAVIRTPVRAPNANARAERWVGSVRRECLDRLLIFSRRQLEHVLRVYTRHYNEHRPHRALALCPPAQVDGNPVPLRAPPFPQLNRRDLLGGLIHEYEHAA